MSSTGCPASRTSQEQLATPLTNTIHTTTSPLHHLQDIHAHQHHPNDQHPTPHTRSPRTTAFMSAGIENLKSFGKNSPSSAHFGLSLALEISATAFSLAFPCAGSPLVEHTPCERCSEGVSYPPSHARAPYPSGPTPHHETRANFPLPTDPFAEADEGEGEAKQSGNYIHIRIQRTSVPQSILSAARRTANHTHPSQSAMAARP